MKISESQSRAIAHGKGPAMVLAGPGSGKTLVITNRTKYLIEERGVSPEEILVITFTKAAAGQMRERFLRLMGQERCRVTFGTFHAVFFQILKHAYHYTASSILRDDQKYRILGGIADSVKLEREDEKEFVADLASEISLVKNEQVPLEHYYSVNCPEEAFRIVYTRYQQQLRKKNLLDFDDMLVYCHTLLKERGDILAQWQRRFRYILVDEFQDINRLQYEVVRMLAEPEQNLFIVGDDDQSIYRFRGAKPEIMLHFQKDYPQAACIRLEENYRSAPEIVAAAGRMIRENKHRFEKDIRCARGFGIPPGKSGSLAEAGGSWISSDGSDMMTAAGGGFRTPPGNSGSLAAAGGFGIPPGESASLAAVEMREFPNQGQEALWIINRIRASRNEGRPYSDLAILTRTNTGGRYLAERLMEFQIPFRMRDRMSNLYDHWIAGDILAYLRLSLGKRERRDFLQVMNRPRRYIGRECLDAPQVSFDSLRAWYEDKPWMVQRIDRMEEDLRRIGRMPPYAAVNFIRHGVAYEGYLKEYAEHRRIRMEELTEVLEELQESARGFQTHPQWFAHIEEYRRTLEKQRETQAKEEQGQDAVVLSTLHSAKGLEFEEVFLPDLNEDVVPHRKAALEADLEEERRLLYVGMTRAKKRLHLFYIKERFGKRMERSRFLDCYASSSSAATNSSYSRSSSH